MDDQTNTRRVAFATLEFLDEEFKKTTTTSDSKESLEVAIQCLETAFGISLRDTQYRSPRSLRELVRNAATSGGGAVGGGLPAATVGAGDSNTVSSSSATYNPLAGASYVNTGPDYVKPTEASEADKTTADELKNKGNDSMKNLSFSEALDHYNKAIQLDGNNAVYFCNRAAAYIKLEQYDKALRDCQIAVQLQPSYARAYGRMGVTYSSQNNHVDAILCYKKALELEPENESYKKNLQISQHMMLQDVPAAQAQAAASPNLQNFFSNPNLINMASQMLQDPSMQQMMQSIMQSFQGGGPAAAAAAAGAGAGAGAGAPGGAAGGGGMESLLQMGQAIAQQIQNSNPNLVDQLTGFGGNPDGRPPPNGNNPDSSNN